MMEPPYQFELGAHTIKIKRVHDLYERDEAYGKWHAGRSLIELQSVGYKCSQSVQNQTFWHEVVHACFEFMGHDKLSSDEVLVDRLGQALCQVVKTMK